MGVYAAWRRAISHFSHAVRKLATISTKLHPKRASAISISHLLYTTSVHRDYSYPLVQDC